MKRWSTRLPAEAIAAVGPMILGLALGNSLLIAVGLVPLFYIILSSRIPGPSGVRMEATEGPTWSWVGETVALGRRIRVDEGTGLIVVGENVPEHFAPASGSNIKVFWKGKDRLDLTHQYSVTGRRRGFYDFGGATAECVHFSGTKVTSKESGEEKRRLMVRQKPLSIKGIRDTRSLTRTAMPVNATSRLGTRSTDFRELRRYVRGDRFRDINWKATVRLAVDEDVPPLVNEYEREGRRTVWVFLDSGRSMSTGTSVSNAFESGVTAASAVSRFFLDRDCEVGLALVGTKKVVLSSDGNRQSMMIERVLQEAEPNAPDGRFFEALSSLEGHIAGSSPLLVLITRVTEKNAQDIRQGFERLKMIGGTGISMTVLDIDGFGLASEDEEDELAHGFLRVAERPAIAEVRAGGAVVLVWDPSTQSFGNVAMRMLSRR